MSIPQPPQPSDKPPGPLERVEPEQKPAPGEKFSHMTPDGYRVYVDARGRMRAKPPAADAWKGLVSP